LYLNNLTVRKTEGPQPLPRLVTLLALVALCLTIANPFSVGVVRAANDIASPKATVKPTATNNKSQSKTSYPRITDSTYIQQSPLQGGGLGPGVALSANGRFAVVQRGINPVVFARNGNTWEQQQILQTSDVFTNVIMGSSSVTMSADANTIVIGIDVYTGQGVDFAYIYIFGRDSSGSWQQQQRLAYAGSFTLSADGNTILMLVLDSSKQTYRLVAYRQTGNNWSEQPDLVMAGQYDYSPQILASSADGNLAVLGIANQNVVYVFARNNNVWSLQQQINDTTPSDTQFGYGVTLSNDGTLLLVKATGQNAAGYFVRIVIYGQHNGLWSEQQELLSTDSSEAFGSSMALSGDNSTLLVGAPWKNNRVGAAYIFKRKDSLSNYLQQQELSSGFPGGDDTYFFGAGTALSADGSVAIVTIAGEHYRGTGGRVACAFVSPSLDKLQIDVPVSVTAGSPVSLSVTALDQFGQPYTSYTGTVHLVNPTSNSGSVPADYSFVPADQGQHTFVGAATFNTSGAASEVQTLTVVDNNNSSLKGAASVFVQANGFQSYTYNLPFLANNASGSSTYVAIQNVGDNPATLNLAYFDTSGNSLATPLTAAAACTNLKVHAECLPAAPFDLNTTDRHGTGIIVSNQPLAVIVAEGTNYGGSAYAVSSGNASQLIAPIALQNAYGDFSTKLTVFNTASTATTITVEFYDQPGGLIPQATQNFTLSAFTAQTLDQSLASSNLPSSQLYNYSGWAKITGASGSQLVGQVMEQSPSQKFAAIMAAQTQTYTRLYAPAIFKGAFGFNTGVNIVNPSSQPISVSITYYDDKGTPNTSQPFPLDAYAAQAVYQGGKGGGYGLPMGNGLPAGFSGAAILTATGAGVVMIVNEGGGVTASGISLGGTYAAAVSGSAKVGLPVMANGGFGYTTGATIFNTSGQVVSGTIQYYDITGTAVGPAQSFNIGPYASQLFYQGSANLLPNGFYGTAIITQTNGGGSMGLIVTTNALSGLFYTYTEPEI
jgi:hypothetical protein